MPPPPKTLSFAPEPKKSPAVPRPAATGPRFDQLILQFLEKHRGVFIGENHDAPAVRQSITKLMPLFHAHGIKTISIELPQDMIDELAVIPSLAALSKHTSAKYYSRLRDRDMESIWKMVHAAQKFDIKVLGHEHPDEANRMASVTSERDKILEDKNLDNDTRIKKLLELRKKAYSQSPMDYDVMRKRDEYAAAYIKKHAVGKYLVIGGGAHSANFAEKDKSTEGRGKNSPTLDKLAEAGYKGLNVRLGIPAIDFDLMQSIAEAGKTLKGDGKASDHDVRLPKNIYEDPSYPWLPTAGMPKKKQGSDLVPPR